MQFKPPEKLHQCDACGLKFNTRVGLREHSKIHETNQPNAALGYGPIKRSRLPLNDAA